jgi:hypothetical protein
VVSHCYPGRRAVGNSATVPMAWDRGMSGRTGQTTELAPPEATRRSKVEMAADSDWDGI